MYHSPSIRPDSDIIPCRFERKNKKKTGLRNNKPKIKAKIKKICAIVTIILWKWIVAFGDYIVADEVHGEEYCASEECSLNHHFPELFVREQICSAEFLVKNRQLGMNELRLRAIFFLFIYILLKPSIIHRCACCHNWVKQQQVPIFPEGLPGITTEECK